MTNTKTQSIEPVSVSDATPFSICSNQTLGACSIGNTSTRTGAIQIATNASTLHQIIIGNTNNTVDQNLNINCPSVNIGSGFTTQTGKSINLGSSGIVAGTGSQTINLNRPLTIGYTQDTPTSFQQLGYYQYFGGTQKTMPTNSSYVTFIETSSLPAGVYMFNYSLNSLITLTTTGDTKIENQIFGISSDQSGTFLAGCSQTVTEDITRPPAVTYNQSFTGVTKRTSSGILYLIGAFTFTTNCTLKITGGVGVVRIG